MSGRRKGSRLAALAVSAAVLGFGASACGGDDGNGGGGGASAEEKTKVGLTIIGPRNDKAFSQDIFEGVEEAIQSNPQYELTSVLENRETDRARTDALRTLGAIDDVVVAGSSSFGPVLDVVAPSFPDAHFINIAGYPKQFHENVTGWANDWGAPAYVIGVIAAHMTKTNTVGFVGGAELPPTTQGAAGFEAGAKSVKPDIKVLTNIVGDFNDVGKGKAATASMIADNADVIYPFLDAGVAGAYAAGKESGKNPAMFRLISPECGGYDNVVGNEFVDIKKATTRLMDMFADGSLEAGAIFTTLKEPELQTFKLCPKYESDEELVKIREETIDGINSGEIELPAEALNPRPDYEHSEGFPDEG